jgi:hypothetical protein
MFNRTSIDREFVQFYVAEVVGYSNNFKDATNIENKFLLNGIIVTIKYNDVTKKIENVLPINTNIKQIPVIGETVLIFQAYDYTSAFNNRSYTWYYFNPISTQSTINNNITPINTVKFEPDSNFITKPISPLQPYMGDTLIEGRWGNSIRFGSTGKFDSNLYSVKPTWIGSTTESPIIILSNSRVNKESNTYITEDIKTDDASLYLTSTQQISNLKLGTDNRKNPLKKYTPGESAFKKSQLIGSADRIVLKAKTDIVVLDSPKGIILNTTGKIHLGNDQASEPMVHGDVLFQIVQDLIRQMRSVVKCGSAVGGFMDTQYVKRAESKLKELRSTKYYLQKQIKQ